MVQVERRNDEPNDLTSQDEFPPTSDNEGTEMDRKAPYVEAYESRKKAPFWIIPVLLALPVWALFYVGTLERVPQGLTGLLGQGEEVYVEAGCAGCHGATGGGGIGPELSRGAVHLTFTSVEDQIVWIARGSAITGTGVTYSSPDSERPRSVRGSPPMPGYGAEASRPLSIGALLAVTLYERTQLRPGDTDLTSDVALAEQLDEMISSGELELILGERNLSLSDTLLADGLTPDVVANYLDPARSPIVG